jgi:hypothetical protein
MRCVHFFEGLEEQRGVPGAGVFQGRTTVQSDEFHTARCFHLSPELKPGFPGAPKPRPFRFDAAAILK